VKMRWPKSYRERMVWGDGRWLVITEMGDMARDRGYKGFIWTRIDMFETRAEADEKVALSCKREVDEPWDHRRFRRPGTEYLVADCEGLSTWYRAKRDDAYLTYLTIKPKPAVSMQKSLFKRTPTITSFPGWEPMGG